MTDLNAKYKADWHRCSGCGTRRATWLSMEGHYKAHPDHRPCNCGGYHYKHSRRSKCCEQNPNANIHRAIREGDEEAYLLLPGVPGGEVPPF